MLKYLLQAAIVAGSMYFIAGDRLEQGSIIRTAIAVVLAFLLIDYLVPRLFEGLSIDPNYGYSRSEIAAIQRELGPTSNRSKWSGYDRRGNGYWNTGASRWRSGANEVNTVNGLSCKRPPSCNILKRIHNQQCNTNYGYNSDHNNQYHRNRYNSKKSSNIVYI